MSAIATKFKLFFLPFLFISVCFTGGYSLLHWALLSREDALGIRPAAIILILPLLLPAIFVFFAYRKQGSVLRLGNTPDNFLFQVVVWAAVVFPAVFAQLCVELYSTHIGHVLALPVPGPEYLRTVGNRMALLPWVLAVSVVPVFLVLWLGWVDNNALYRYQRHLAGPREPNLIANLFVPNGSFYITPIIIDLNLLVFVLMVASGLGFGSFPAVDLWHWGGNFRPSLLQGEWWRLLTGIFLHGGFTHLASNMVSLMFIGYLLEGRLGRLRYALAYLISGIGASLASAVWHPATVSIGASGAIFGLYGVFLVFMFAKIFPKDFRRQFLRITLVFIIYNLAMGYSGNIDNAAHMGGLLSGVLMGLLFFPATKRNIKKNELAKKATIIPLVPNEVTYP